MTSAGGAGSGAPGWYPAPDRPGQLRWWDGYRWSDSYQFGYPSQLPYFPGARAVRPPVHPGTLVYRWTIWAIALLPSAVVLLELLWYPTFRYRTLVSGGRLVRVLDLGSVFTPTYFLVIGASWVVYGLCVWFAYLDRRDLARRGVVRPFHWAWAFLSPTVYLVGRSVIVFKVARPKGLAPVWVHIVALVLGVILVSIRVATAVHTVAGSIPT